LGAGAGYGCVLYVVVLGEWTRHDWSFRVNGAGSRVESLWLNPAAVDARGRAQASLFDAAEAVSPGA